MIAVSNGRRIVAVVLDVIHRREIRREYDAATHDDFALYRINTWVSMNILLHWDSSKPRILCHVARVAAWKSPQAQIMDAILWCASGGCFSRISFVTNGQNRKRRFRTRTVGIVVRERFAF